MKDFEWCNQNLQAEIDRLRAELAAAREEVLRLTNERNMACAYSRNTDLKYDQLIQRLKDAGFVARKIDATGRGEGER